MIVTVIRIKVIPRSSQNKIIGKESDVFKVKLTVPPIDGKANSALLKFLAKKLGVPKAAIEIVSGERSRTKSIQIQGLSTEEIDKRLT